MNIPTIIFINKIDQAGVDLQAWFQSVQISSPPILSSSRRCLCIPGNSLEENTDIEAWDAVIENNDKLLKSISQENQSAEVSLCGRGTAAGSRRLLFRSIIASAKAQLAHSALMDAVTGLFQPIGNRGAPPYAAGVFKVEYTDCGQRRVSIYGYTAIALRLRIRWPWPERKAENHRDAYSIQREIVRTNTAYPGEICYPSQRQREV